MKWTIRCCLLNRIRPCSNASRRPPTGLVSGRRSPPTSEECPRCPAALHVSDEVRALAPGFGYLPVEAHGLTNGPSDAAGSALLDEAARRLAGAPRRPAAAGRPAHRRLARRVHRLRLQALAHPQLRRGAGQASPRGRRPAAHQPPRRPLQRHQRRPPHPGGRRGPGPYPGRHAAGTGHRRGAVRDRGGRRGGRRAPRRRARSSGATTRASPAAAGTGGRACAPA